MLSESVILVLLAIAALGVASSQLGAPPSHNQQLWNNSTMSRSPVDVTNVRTSPTWSGVSWSQGAQFFKSVSGTFTVPTPQDNGPSYGSIAVGFDGLTCETAIFQTGVDFAFDNGKVIYYDAWSLWFPGNLYYFPSEDITIRGGDVITAAVNATSPTSGAASIYNHRTGIRVGLHYGDWSALCLQDAYWIIEAIAQAENEYLPLGKFGTLTFTDATAVGFNEATYQPTDSATAIIYMVQPENDQTLSSVSANGDSLTIKYVDTYGCF